MHISFHHSIGLFYQVRYYLLRLDKTLLLNTDVNAIKYYIKAILMDYGNHF